MDITKCLLDVKEPANFCVFTCDLLRVHLEEWTFGARGHSLKRWTLGGSPVTSPLGTNPISSGFQNCRQWSNLHKKQ